MAKMNPLDKIKIYFKLMGITIRTRKRGRPRLLIRRNRIDHLTLMADFVDKLEGEGNGTKENR